VTPDNLQPRASVVVHADDADAEVQLNGYAEGIEAAAKVGDRARNHQLDARRRSIGLK
jgi:hypothetical protein